MSPLKRRRRTPRVVRLLRLGRQRPVRAGVAIAAGALLLFGLWSVWTAYRVASDVEDARSRGEVLAAAMTRGDVQTSEEALADFQAAAESAESTTSGPTWWIAERLPVVGDDAEGVAEASAILADLGRDALPPLVEAAEQVTARAFQPTGARFPLETIAAVQEPAERSRAAFEQAQDRLAEIDTSGFSPQLRTRFDVLRDLVVRSGDVLGSAYRAAAIAPALLGADGPRDYLLVLQNNAELRSTGGLPGSISVVHAEDGRVDIVDQVAAANIRELPEPVLPLTDDERGLFGPILGTYFLDANLTPDVPRAADLMRASWERATGQDVDGVIMVDPVAVSYLLAAVGPVEVPGYEPVDATNVVALVENQIYLSTIDRQVQEDYQNAVAEAVFDAFAQGRGDPADLIRGLATGVAEGRIRLHSFDDDVQAELDGTAIAGELPGDDEPHPTVGVYLNDSTPSKMSYYLRYRASLVARSCTGGVQDLVGSVDMVNDVPDGVDLPISVTGDPPPGEGVVPGMQVVQMYLMAPPGGHFTELEIDGRRVDDPALIDFEGREVAAITSVLDPDGSREIDYVLRTGASQRGDPRLEVTPGAFPGSSTATVPSAC